MAGKNVKMVPWVERYKPKHLGEVIGNTDAVRKLAEWLRDWDDVVLHGKTKEAPAPEAWQKFNTAPENINARACLVSGPPGIGKTTTCVLVARCNLKYKLMEFNASDARGKNIIEQMSASLAGNHTLKLSGPNDKSKGDNKKGGSGLERAVIIMDECDGMSSGDKGGMAAMMNMIKATKSPIICICNDRNDQGVRNLASVCLDIKFKRPDNKVVAKRIKHVMDGEGKTVDLHAIESVVEACGHDIRHIINQTQFFGSVSAHGGESQKDGQQMLSPFDACVKMLTSDGKKKPLPSMEKRLDMFYLDADMMPLMVHENYLRALEKKGGDEIELSAKAAELIALGDTMAGSWEVQSSSAVLGTIYPAFLAADDSFTKPGFPAWLQKKGPIGKAQRTVTEMHGKLRLSTSCTIHDLSTTSYHDVLYRRLLKPLQYGAVKEAATALFACGLNREFFTDQCPTIRAPLMLEDLYKKLEGKVKTQLLTELQALAAAAAPAPVKRKQTEGGGNKKKNRGPGDAGDTADMEVDEGGGGDADEAGGDAAAKKKKNTKKPKASASAASLQGWRKAEVVLNSQGEDVANIAKDPLMIFRYLDGHTCAVRRTVHASDVLEPWTLF